MIDDTKPESQVEGLKSKMVDYVQKVWKSTPGASSIPFGRHFSKAPIVNVNNPSKEELDAWTELSREFEAVEDEWQ